MRMSFLSGSESIRRLVIAGARLTTLLWLGASLTACPPPPPPKKVESAEERAEKEKYNKAKQLIDKANVAFGDKEFDKARKLLREANEMQIDSLTFQLKEEMEKVDKRHAKLWANEAEDALQEGDCKAAFAQLASPMRDLESDVFDKELRKNVGSALVKCLQGKLDSLTGSGNYAGARARRRELHARARRGGGDPGPVGRWQEHAAQPRRRARSAHLRTRDPRRRVGGRSRRRRARSHSRHQDRLRLPGAPPAAAMHSVRER
ncbi:MAG TPA: hypothetical protein PKA58_34330, partial [Polyangium sp.]|nr:hypothetical protein [Polyangium sp.]